MSTRTEVFGQCDDGSHQIPAVHLHELQCEEQPLCRISFVHTTAWVTESDDQATAFTSAIMDYFTASSVELSFAGV